jgi:hypothetical protein
MTIWDTWAADPRYSQVVSDPRFLAATPAFKSKIHDILFKYGFTEGADTTGMSSGNIEANPYSVLAKLKQGRTSSDHASINAANAANLEESGAAVGALNANNENFKRYQAEAAAQQGQELSGALGDYTGTIGDIFNDVEMNPIIAPQPIPQPVGPAPGQATGAGTAFPTPQVPYNRTGPEAGWNTVASKVKKIVGPQNVGLPGYR